MRDLPGFSNIAYFDTEWERDLFISNVEDIPDVVLTKLDVITRDDVPMYPIHFIFTDEEPNETPPLINLPF
jgi:hypothetical protein